MRVDVPITAIAAVARLTGCTRTIIAINKRSIPLPTEVVSLRPFLASLTMRSPTMLLLAFVPLFHSLLALAAVTPRDSAILAGPIGPDCVDGAKHAGDSKGTNLTIAGVPTYYSKPLESSKNVILFFSDIYSPFYINNELLQDYFAGEGALRARMAGVGPMLTGSLHRVPRPRNRLLLRRPRPSARWRTWVQPGRMDREVEEASS